MAGRAARADAVVRVLDRFGTRLDLRANPVTTRFDPCRTVRLAPAAALPGEHGSGAVPRSSRQRESSAPSDKVLDPDDVSLRRIVGRLYALDGKISPETVKTFAASSSTGCHPPTTTLVFTTEPDHARPPWSRGMIG